MNKKTILYLLIGLTLNYSPLVSATIVQFQTVMGNFEVNLYDQSTPETTENFLAYVTGGVYENSIIHRTVNNFIVQGGGFTYNDTNTPVEIVTGAAITNEPLYSNVRGTISMAKLGGNPNSATSQWFFNLSDNSATLDTQNGGFTVFGEVIGDGMTIIDAISDLTRFNLGGAFSETPLRDYSAQNANDGVPITDEHLVIVEAIVILDGAIDTASDLSPTPNTLIAGSSSSSSSSSSSGGEYANNSDGGGFVHPGILLLLIATLFLQKQSSRSITR